MQRQDPLRKDQEGLVPQDPLRTVPPLQAGPAGQMGHEMLIGIPRRFHRAILDADFLRRRSANFAGKGRKAVTRQLIERLANEGTASWDSADDPLFWCLRAWGNIWTPPPPSSDVEPSQLDFAQLRVPGGFAPTTIVYRSMAAWACRLSAPELQVRALCLQIHRQVRAGETGKQYRFPLPKTCSWLRWLGIACERYFPIPDQELGTFNAHYDRWQEMGFRPDDAKFVFEALQEVFDPPRSGYLREKTSYGDC